jgi:hypothetical protein
MSISHSALTRGTALALLIASASAAAAQTSSTGNKWELRFTSGAFVPTGSQRKVLENAQVSGAQLSWVVQPALAITGTFGWARSRDRGTVDNPKLDVFTSDLGVEYRKSTWNANGAMTLSPFVGMGAGMRSYNYRKLDVDATNNVAGYAAAGGELGMGRVGVRLEVRDYVAGFKPLMGVGESRTHNDLVIMAALRFNVHHSSQN